MQAGGPESLTKTSIALGTMLVLLALPYFSPRLRALQVVHLPWQNEPRDDDAEPAASAPALPRTVAVGDQRLAATENRGAITNALPATHATEAKEALDPDALAAAARTVAIVDSPAGDAGARSLDPFYASLARTLRKEAGAVTRILHYGDSVIAGDLISGTMRRRMQERFGDAGHGFILIANPWEWYFQNDIAHSASDGWNANKLTGPWPDDHVFGLGGVSFHTREQASAFFATRADGDYGRKVSRFDLFYMEQPRGGTILLTATGRPAEKLSTRIAPDAPDAGEVTARRARVKSVAIDDGAGSLSLRALGDGDVRVFGVALERDRPGVVYDALGAHAARASFWSTEDPADWALEMKLRAPSLVILQFGTNESEDTSIRAETYAPVFGTLIEEVQRAAPGVPILVVSPLDRAIKGSDGELKTSPVIERIIAGQRAAAAEHGVAFWSTFDAMGGRGTMARWRHTRPQLGNNDLSHPTPAGAEILGNLFSSAIFAGYTAYASTHPDAPAIPDVQVPPP